MTKSNREVKGEMGGNVLDERKARVEIATEYRWVPRAPEMYEVIDAHPGDLITGCLDDRPAPGRLTIGGFTAPSEPVTFTGREQHAAVLAWAESEVSKAILGEPVSTTPRERIKARSRGALRSGDGRSEYDARRAAVSIAREQNPGLRDAYVVRLDGAPQFTTYDAEEALDIFADMVT